jgi:hypothetical protein
MSGSPNGVLIDQPHFGHVKVCISTLLIISPIALCLLYVVLFALETSGKTKAWAHQFAE